MTLIKKNKHQHNWKIIGELLYYEKDAPIMEALNSPYEGYIKRDNKIYVVFCPDCLQVKLIYNPWKKILGDDKNVE